MTNNGTVKLLDATHAASTLMVRYTVNRIITKTMTNSQFIAWHRPIVKI